MPEVRIITNTHDGRILTNNNIWTADSKSLLYDTRSDRLGDTFDGTRIMQIDVLSGHEQCLFLSKHGAGCGVVTTHPFDDRYVFIAGPENPSPDWTYGPSHRQGIIGHRSSPQTAHNMDARELSDRPSNGALRGGTHVHVWHPKGDWLRSTYNDASVAPKIRDIAVHLPGNVDVSASNARNHSGNYHSFIVTNTVQTATKPDHITRAYEETWLGTTQQLAFMADTVDRNETVTEVFKVDVANLALSSEHTFDKSNRIKPPAGITQSRLTTFAGTDLRIVKQPRHWLVSSPDGNTIAFLLESKRMNPQIFTLDLPSMQLNQRTNILSGVTTAISWSAKGSVITFGADRLIFALDTNTWKSLSIATVTNGELLPLTCCVSPDEKSVAIQIRDTETNHIGIVRL